jgi:hypothetical protein
LKPRREAGSLEAVPFEQLGVETRERGRVVRGVARGGQETAVTDGTEREIEPDVVDGDETIPENGGEETKQHSKRDPADLRQLLEQMANGGAV